MGNPHPNPAPAWLSEKSWAEIVRANDLPSLNGFQKSVTTRTNEWKAIYDNSAPQNMTFPEPFSKTRGLDRLVILRCLRPDKIVPAVQVRSHRIRWQ
ncbi:unnamed protein product [Dibothriocephalus latus]|uniref:Uncharacterized protein n=1 Tax=Dibothriocephalus latus TaxID=60516 RepID=A0A3P7P3Y2_DIBLA|nr:unnamed protein product [Dibothriocephalus latus]